MWFRRHLKPFAFLSVPWITRWILRICESYWMQPKRIIIKISAGTVITTSYNHFPMNIPGQKVVGWFMWKMHYNKSQSGPFPIIVPDQSIESAQVSDYAGVPKYAVVTMSACRGSFPGSRGKVRFSGSCYYYNGRRKESDRVGDAFSACGVWWKWMKNRWYRLCSWVCMQTVYGFADSGGERRGVWRGTRMPVDRMDKASVEEIIIWKSNKTGRRIWQRRTWCKHNGSLKGSEQPSDISAKRRKEIWMLPKKWRLCTRIRWLELP